MSSERRLNTQKVMDFVNENDIIFRFRALGKPGPGLSLVLNGAATPFPGGEPGRAAVDCIIRLMQAKGVQPFYDDPENKI